jgi:hypothetical protein
VHYLFHNKKRTYALGIRRTDYLATQQSPAQVRPHEAQERCKFVGFLAKKSATPKGCAKIPPKEEVLEDVRRHL